jgi:hypothetical protein
MRYLVAVYFLFFLAVANAQEPKKPVVGATPKPAAKKASNQENSWITVRKSNFDFDETLLQGKMSAPDGFMLQGRKEQDKKQMVNLRESFKTQLMNSRAAVRAIKP